LIILALDEPLLVGGIAGTTCGCLNMLQASIIVVLVNVIQVSVSDLGEGAIGMMDLVEREEVIACDIETCSKLSVCHIVAILKRDNSRFQGRSVAWIDMIGTSFNDSIFVLIAFGKEDPVGAKQGIPRTAPPAEPLTVLNHPLPSIELGKALTINDRG
jgi:hypothetical protein